MAQDTYVAPSLITSGTTFAQLLTGGWAALIANLTSANPAIVNPTTALTMTATGGGSTGGSLPAGAYLASYTWVDGAGETLVGTSELASAVTVAAGNIPQVTIPAVPTGACAANIYLTAAGGASRSETLYATGVTTTTFNLSFAAGADTTNPVPPTANTTGAVHQSKWINTLMIRNQAAGFGDRLSQLVDQYISGGPVGFKLTRDDLAHLNYVLAFWTQAGNEISALIAGQAQSLHQRAGLIMPSVMRTFP
jgi:hypothetical protein